MTHNGKAKIEKTANGLNLIVPSKKNWAALLFGTFWIGTWFFGFLMVGRMFPSIAQAPEGLGGFMTFWLFAWTLGGLGILFVLLWGYFGQEKFLLHRSEVFFEKSVFGIGLKKTLDRTAIANFRAETSGSGWLGGNNLAFWGLGPGKIKFDYGMKTYSFGLGVDDAEANYIVRLLKEQFAES